MAQQVWDQYGPGGASYFGGTAVDGFDFDFEMAMDNLLPFTQKLKQLQKSHPSFLLTAAPQCQWPDQNLGSVLTSHMNWFDAIFVQFYNNPECGIPSGYARRSGGPSARRWRLSPRGFNLGTWLNMKNPTETDTTGSFTKSPKIFVGVPGSEAGTPSANMGYAIPSLIQAALSPFMASENFGGVSIWEVSYAAGNGDFLQQVRGILGA